MYLLYKSDLSNISSTHNSNKNGIFIVNIEEKSKTKPLRNIEHNSLISMF